MKEQLSKLVEGMTKDGFDFSRTTAIFKWIYEEYPNLKFELTIKQADPQ